MSGRKGLNHDLIQSLLTLRRRGHSSPDSHCCDLIQTLLAQQGSGTMAQQGSETVTQISGSEQGDSGHTWTTAGTASPKTPLLLCYLLGDMLLPGHLG